MKTRHLLTLIFAALCSAGADELKWVEKEVYTVSAPQSGGTSIVKVKVATPELTGYAGFFSAPGSHGAAKASGIKTAGITPGRLDAWEKEEAVVPQKFIDAALDPKDVRWQSLALTADPTRRSEKPLCQWGHSIYIVLKPEGGEKSALHPKTEWSGFQITSCALETKKSQLPVVYSRVTDPSKNLSAEFLGLLDIETGRVSEVLQDSDLFSGHIQLTWITDQKIAVTGSSRYGVSGAVIDLTGKKVAARQFIPGAASWLIANGRLLAWHLHPGAIPIGPGD